MAKRRFNSEQNAKSFASKVDGRLNDLRDDEKAKSKFSVTYESTEGTRLHKANAVKHWNEEADWCPEEDRDFGYPNSYWKD